MRSFGTADSTSVQADRHGPSITTRSPDARTRANRSRNGPTSPPGLARMRTSAEAGEANADSRTARKRCFAKVVRIPDTSVGTRSENLARHSGMRHRTRVYPSSAISLSKSATADLDARARKSSPTRCLWILASLAPRNDGVLVGDFRAAHQRRLLDIVFRESLL